MCGCVCVVRALSLPCPLSCSFMYFAASGSSFSHVSATQKSHADKNPPRISISGPVQQSSKDAFGPYFAQSCTLDSKHYLFNATAKGLISSLDEQMVIGHFGIGDNLSHSNHIELQVKTRLNFGSLDLASPSLPPSIR